MMREPLFLLGCAIKKIRKSRKFTLQNLAQKTGLSSGLLSKIENFRTIPSLPVLVSISSALEIDLAELFHGMTVDPRKNWLRIHAEDRKPVEREENRTLSYSMILETAIPVGGNMQLMHVRVPHGSGSADVTTEADELLYILKGHFAYRIAGEPVDLVPGDCLFFNGRLPHAPSNSGDEAELLAFYFFRDPEN